MAYRYEWRGEFANEALNALHAEGFEHRVRHDNWRGQVERHSLGWVCAHQGDDLIGFVNIAWDGAAHEFVLDTLVAARCRRQGVGKELLAVAVTATREAGCEWLHVDFDDQLCSFYFDAGFVRTDAGLINLSETRDSARRV